MKLHTVGDVVLRIEAGKSPKTLERPPGADEPGVLKVSAVSWGRFDPDAAKAVSDTTVLNLAHSVKSGDVLISRANTLDLVGAVAMAEASYSNRYLSDKILRLVLNLDAVVPEFLLYAMRSERARRHLRRNASGASDSMRNIGQPAILRTPIPLPSLAEQRLIAASIRTQLELTESIRQGLAQQLADVDRLPRRILANAFGEGV